ncbi:HK97 gp10 family phage protein [Rummeliibacillus suwonensis]|uniref:HK97 gp10 family phage protein n=1 Tax=Rummeliibacillus suwonensis TaxID=1306154 RepID=UPI0011B4FB37|nr:HK97 gp10 family phage protein [Rummeliibacillus suwonensis]
MSIKFNGFDEVLKELEKQMKSSQLSKVTNKALEKGAEVVKKEVVKEFEKFKDTGASIEEIVISKVSVRGGEKSVKLGWNGPKGRYRIIHLNEFGYDKNGKKIKPKGYGALKHAIDNSQQAYFDSVYKELKQNQ